MGVAEDGRKGMKKRGESGKNAAKCVKIDKNT